MNDPTTLTRILWWPRGRFSVIDVKAGWRDELLSARAGGWRCGALDYRLGWFASVVVR